MPTILVNKKKSSTMRVEKAILAFLTAAGVFAWDMSCEAAPSARPRPVQLCGRKLSEVMSKVCKVYNSPSWDPLVVKKPEGSRSKRQIAGIANECCAYGCTLEQLELYCSEPHSTSTESLAHQISGRSAEAEAAPASPAVVARGGGGGGEVGRGRSRGYARGRRRGRARCWCRRKRRSGRRRADLMGNTRRVTSVVRAAPVVGTVSPLLTWGRTLQVDFPPTERDRYAYVVSTTQ